MSLSRQIGGSVRLLGGRWRSSAGARIACRAMSRFRVSVKSNDRRHVAHARMSASLPGRTDIRSLQRDAPTTCAFARAQVRRRSGPACPRGRDPEAGPDVVGLLVRPEEAVVLRDLSLPAARADPKHGRDGDALPSEAVDQSRSPGACCPAQQWRPASGGRRRAGSNRSRLTGRTLQESSNPRVQRFTSALRD